MKEEAGAHIFTAQEFEIKADMCRQASRKIRRKINELRNNNA